MYIDLRYTVGYKTALRHVIQWFDRHDESLRFMKLRKYKGIKLILKKLYEGADKFMEEGDMHEFSLTREEIEKAGGKF